MIIGSNTAGFSCIFRSMHIAIRRTSPARLLLLLWGLFVAASGLAQEAQVPEPPAQPDLASLQQNWWAYFEGAPDVVGPRVDAFLEETSRQLVSLGALNQEAGSANLEAVRDNLRVYLSLLRDPGIEARQLTEPAPVYTVEELLETAARSREARLLADDARLEVEREQRVLTGATRRRDAAFKDYLNAVAGDERWLAGLQLVRVRASQAISVRRLEILQQNAAAASDYAEALSSRINLELERLAPGADAELLDKLVAAVDKAAEEVAVKEQAARAAQTTASSLDVDTAEGRFDQRLNQQRAVDADVELAGAQIALAIAEARRYFAALKLADDIDVSVVEGAALRWSELLRNLGTQLPDWKRQTEDEMLSVQRIDRADLGRNARRLLDQRIGTAQETLAHVAELSGAIADLELLMTAVDSAIADYSGAFRLWISNFGRGLKTSWIRLSEVADRTLFSVGETPVTSGDIVQAILILAIGWGLSRGIRIGIRRMGQKDSIGRQAALYTISRLTHYSIILLALLIALTSIGLDFTNLALVAGALSVGIGFCLQSIVNNFVSGLIILFERALRVGDYIELDNGLTGTVKAINVRSTLINTNDNIDIVVPNSEFVSTRLTNWTLAEHILRMRIPFGVAYGSDKELVKKAAIEACAHVPYTLTHMPGREPDVWLVEYGDNSLNFLLLVWVNRQGARRPTRTRAAYLWELETKLKEYGIEIPFPQRDLHLKSGWPSREGPALATPFPDAPSD
jgi:small-conductance mechanosensitive channel